MGDPPTEEVLITELNDGDRLVLQTDRSSYTFTMVDAASRRGTLAGGQIQQPRDAVFSGSLLTTHEIWDVGFRTGTRATFFLVVPHELAGYSQVMTSPLIGLQVVRARRE